ncbi:hypothetical protein BQ8794_90022 [Mesorhizobium prunaredense]|uniref:Uncharacterized protein n=1 Tax=Mesorhizobium prunaredense TaxID=1631249 RepID=A0A1R3VIX2_9HYPH|nr:hypothetical protein [Mesorhizobium prunaredense]SIT59857.1 hypothetical protein BQ8794_90022 [Mesorhizobium prunaredense]
MNLVRVGPDEVFHRYLTPRWAYVPVSGAGTAIDGGSANLTADDKVEVHDPDGRLPRDQSSWQ